jgi:hypothetical protein
MSRRLKSIDPGTVVGIWIEAMSCMGLRGSLLVLGLAFSCSTTRTSPIDNGA